MTELVGMSVPLCVRAAQKLSSRRKALEREMPKQISSHTEYDVFVIQLQDDENVVYADR